MDNKQEITLEKIKETTVAAYYGLCGEACNLPGNLFVKYAFQLQESLKKVSDVDVEYIHSCNKSIGVTKYIQRRVLPISRVSVKQEVDGYSLSFWVNDERGGINVVLCDGAILKYVDELGIISIDELDNYKAAVFVIDSKPITWLGFDGFEK